MIDFSPQGVFILGPFSDEYNFSSEVALQKVFT